MGPHETSHANMAIKRGAPEDIQAPPAKRLQETPKIPIIIEDEGESAAVRYMSPRPPWPPRETIGGEGGEDTARVETRQQESQQVANTLRDLPQLNIREEKNMAVYIAELEQKVRRLESDVSELTKDLLEREKLYKEAFQAQQNRKDGAELQPQVDELLKENKKMKKSAKVERRTLVAERDELQELLEKANKVILYDQTQLDASQEQYKELLAQKQKIEKDFKKRGEKIIKLTRDLNDTINSKTHPAPTPAKPKKENRVPRDETKHALLTRLGGMYAHYRTLYDKNVALVEKLMNMAKAGGFGHHSSLYRREVEGLRGLKLEVLEEYKTSL